MDRGRTRLGGMDWLRVRMTEMRAGRLWPAAQGVRTLWFVAAAVLALMLIGGIVLAVVAARTAPMVRARLLTLLQAQLGPQVQLGQVHTHFRGVLLVDVDGMEAASVQRGMAGDSAHPMLHVDHVEAEMGLIAALNTLFAGHDEVPGTLPTSGRMVAQLSRVVLDGVHLRFGNGTPGRAALQFDLPRVELTGLDRLGSSKTFDYRATVYAGAPIGLVETQGELGPWNGGDPRNVPLRGSFAFDRRSVSAVHGLHGLLSMRAKYTGTLSTMAVEGTTDDPEFGLGVSAHTVDLKTSFRMAIDATRNTVTIGVLDAHFLQTHFLINGTVTKAANGGYQLDMALNVPAGRVEDALLLGASTEPPLLRGALVMTGHLQMPAGDAAVARKLQLSDGRFHLQGVQFGKGSVQRSADELSEKAGGHPQQANRQDAAASSAMVTGAVALQDGVMQLSAVHLQAPGTTLALNGHYLLGGGGFEMRGTLHTSATASEMSSGIKRVLIRPFNGLFAHGQAGMTLPIEVTGSGNEPHFRVTMPGGSTMQVLQ